MKLGLGTVQFGMNYGVSNRNGQPTVEEASEILALATFRGIRVLDTAPLYGTSEDVLGEILPSHHEFCLVTKTPKFNKPEIRPADAHYLERIFLRSLERMRVARVYGLLVHRTEDLFVPGSQLLLETMQDLRERGLVEKLGVSLYHPEHLDLVLDRFKVDLVQLPLNVFDRRMLSKGHLTKLKQMGVEIHARSVFLQGLLLMQPALLPPYFARVQPHLERYHDYLRTQNLSPVRAALGFVTSVKELDAIICGVTSRQELQILCTEMNSPREPNGLKNFALEDASILDPSSWQL